MAMEVDSIPETSILLGRNVICRRGLKIVSNVQVKHLIDDTLNSTVNTTMDVPSESSESGSYLASENISGPAFIDDDRPLTASDRQKKILQLRQKWAENERAMGGAYNHFKERKEFLPHFSFCDEDVGSENTAPKDNQVAKQQPEVIELSPDPAPGSQGRFGQGCSTPQRINNTLAPLRQWEVSAVISLDNTIDKDNVLREVASNSAEKPDNAGTFCFAKPKLLKNGPVPVAPKADDSMSDVVSTMASISKQAGNGSGLASIPQLSTVMEHDNISKPAGDTFTIPTAPQENITELCSAESSVAGPATFVIEKNNTVDKLDEPTIAECRPIIESMDSGTFVVDNNRTFEVKKDVEQANSAKPDPITPAPPVSQVNDDPTDSGSDDSGTFVIDRNPTIEVKKADPIKPDNVFTTKSVSKVKLDMRNKREAQINQSKSLLDDMSIGIDSPGSVLFANRPSKRNCDPNTPQNMRLSNLKGQAAEKTIAMFDVSQGNSMIDVDDSMVDPVTDPRLTPIGPATPTRSLKHRPRSITKNNQKRSDDISFDDFVNAVPSSSFSATKANVQPIPLIQPATPTPVPGYCRPTLSSLTKARLSGGRLSLGRADGRNENYDSPVLNIDPSMIFAQNIMSGARPRRIRESKISLLTKKLNLADDERENMRRSVLSARDKSMIMPTETNDNAGLVASSLKEDISKPNEDPVKEPSTDKCAVDNQLALAAGSLRLDDMNRNDLPSGFPDLPVFSDPPRRSEFADTIDRRSLFSEAAGRQPGPSNNLLLSDSVYSQSSPQNEFRSSNFRIVTSNDSMDATSNDSSVDETRIMITAALESSSKVEYVLKPLKIIRPKSPDNGLRRSERVRLPPTRRHLGEMPRYVASPSGSGNLHLAGVTKVRLARPEWGNPAKKIDDDCRKRNQKRKMNELKRQRRNRYDSDDLVD